VADSTSLLSIRSGRAASTGSRTQEHRCGVPSYPACRRVGAVGIGIEAGATVIGHGQVVLVLDPAELFANAAQRSAAHTRTQPRDNAPAPRLVLVVDDSLTVRRVTTRMLAREGYLVATAKDGLDALGQIEDAVPDLVLVDIEMPRMDGFELTGRLRANPRTSGVPIIMISSRKAERHQHRAAELGANDFSANPMPKTNCWRRSPHCCRGRALPHRHRRAKVSVRPGPPQNPRRTSRPGSIANSSPPTTASCSARPGLAHRSVRISDERLPERGFVILDPTPGCAANPHGEEVLFYPGGREPVH
jgi:CheY-like chemotaxis protein